MCATGLNTICKRTSNKQRRRLEVQVHDGVGVVHDGVGVVHDGVLLVDLVVLLVDVPSSTSAQRYTHPTSGSEQKYPNRMLPYMVRKLSALDQRLMTPDSKKENNNIWRTGGGGRRL